MGDHLFLIFLLLATEVFLAVSLGICISYIAKTPQTTSVISIVFVQLANFFGGAYFPFTAEEGTFLHLIVNLSPLHWANKGILDVIYAGSFDTAFSVLFGNIGIALLCILITTFALQRREGL
ncbi:ABC transporter permease [Priestia filamentosa]|uniref:ABC transporter permease n=1 Tax=Priestia filamentosa TaxID=1402861 RepID=UPI0023EC4AB4|nr:ABC transporter permease [Priestia filamentosa]